MKSPAKALRADFFTAGSSNAIPNPTRTPPQRNKRKEPCKYYMHNVSIYTCSILS